MEYLDWNTRLAENFFSSEKASRKVYLYATKELIEKIGGSSGENFDAFVQKVREGPDWVHRAGLCQRVLEAMNGWRNRNLPYPPYIAFLSLFVIAAGLEGDFEPHSYYPRLWKVLGEDSKSGTPPSFDKMLGVWDDLETWSTVDKCGELGVFQVTIIGGWIHVGVPLSRDARTRKRSAVALGGASRRKLDVRNYFRHERQKSPNWSKSTRVIPAVNFLTKFSYTSL